MCRSPDCSYRRSIDPSFRTDISTEAIVLVYDAEERSEVGVQNTTDRFCLDGPGLNRLYGTLDRYSAPLGIVWSLLGMLWLSFRRWLMCTPILLMLRWWLLLSDSQSWPVRVQQTLNEAIRCALDERNERLGELEKRMSGEAAADWMYPCLLGRHVIRLPLNNLELRDFSMQFLQLGWKDLFIPMTSCLVSQTSVSPSLPVKSNVTPAVVFAAVAPCSEGKG